VPATFYIASLPFQDTPQIGGFARGYLRPSRFCLPRGRANDRKARSTTRLP
jgi:hypothetical protein